MTTAAVTSQTPSYLGSLDTGSISLGSADSLGDDTAGLTPDALMTYCQSRLGSIDGQIETAFNDQQTRTTESQDIQGVLALLQGNQAGTTDASTCASMESSLQQLIAKVQTSDPGSPALPALEQTYNNMVYSGTGPTSANPYLAGNPAQTNGPQGDNTLSPDEMTSYINAVQGAVSNLDSGAELQMIQIQSLMSQRQTAISLTTNLVQSLGDQTNKIAENIGH
jgi:hypothetical protein